MHETPSAGPDGDQDLPECAWWLAAKQVGNIGPAKFRVLLEQFGSMEQVWHAPERDLRHALDARTLPEFLSARHALDVAALWRRTTSDDIRVTCWTDVDYPSLLREIPAPPPLLYYRGHIAETDSTAVALKIGRAHV